MGKEQRYDVMILSSNKGHRLNPRGAHAIISHLALSGKASPYEEAVAKSWTEVYMEPGPSASEIFTKLGYSGPQPVYKEAALYFTTKEPVELEYGDPGRKIWFYLEFRGCTFKEPFGRFRKLFLEAFNIRVETFWRKHDGELPEHRVVPEGEEPEDPALERRQRSDRSSGKMGTEVHEW